MDKIKKEAKLFSIAVFIAILVRSLFFEPFHIPSGSMRPGLLVGDFIFVSKYEYGYSRYSFPFGLMPIKDRVFAKTPERGDVIVFRLPSNPSINYIKRLIGLPGDVIQVKDSVLYLNGKAVERKMVKPFTEKDVNGKEFIVDQYQEILPSGKSYNIIEKGYKLPQDNTNEYIVPEGHYFFMGDNRDNSKDSRFYDVSFVPERNIVGQAKIIFMSYDRSENSNSFFYHIYEFFTKMRFSRILDSVK